MKGYLHEHVSEGTDEGKQATAAIEADVFATFFPAAADLAAMLTYFQRHTYLSSDWSDRIALANSIAGGQPSMLSTWARENFPGRR